MKTIAREGKKRWLEFSLTYSREIHGTLILNNNSEKKQRNRCLAFFMLNNDTKNPDCIWNLSLQSSKNQYIKNSKESVEIIYEQSSNQSFNSLVMKEARKLLMKSRWQARSTREAVWVDISNKITLFFNRDGKFLKVVNGKQIPEMEKENVK